MRPHKPTITTTQNGEKIELSARYETPGWASFILSIREFSYGLLTIVLFGGGTYWLFTSQLGFTTGQTVVMALTWLAGSWAIARVIAFFVTDYRFGLLPGGDRRLLVTFAREHIAVHSGKAKGTYARGPVLRFTAQAHAAGKHEGRHSEWSQQHGPHTLRDSFQIWLQHGERIIELAAVSSEDEANAMARRLQATDEQSSRGAADTETFGNRSEPE